MVIRTLISAPVRWAGTIVVLWILLNVISITGYPTGAPMDACRDMMPGHNVPPQDNINRLGITMTTSVMTDDDEEEDTTVHVTLMGIQPVWGFFKGFMIQARHVGEDTPVGSFTRIPEGQKGLDCNGVEDSAVTHTNRNQKFGVSFSWKPSKKDDATNLVFIATIVKTYNLYWTNITSDVLFPFVSTTPSGKNDQDKNYTSTDPMPTTDGQVSTVVMETTQSSIENSTVDSTTSFQNISTMAPITNSTTDSTTSFQNVTTMPPLTNESSMTTGYNTTNSPSNTTKEYTTEYSNLTTDSVTKSSTDSENATTITYDTTMFSNVTDNVTTIFASTGVTVDITSESISNVTTEDLISTTESILNSTSYTTSIATGNSSGMNSTTVKPDSTTMFNTENATTSFNFSTANATVPADNMTTTQEPVVTTDTVITAPTTLQTTRITEADASTTMDETQTNATFTTMVTLSNNETFVGNLTTTPSSLNTTNTSLTSIIATTTVSTVTNDSFVNTNEMTTVSIVTSGTTVSSTTLNGTSSTTTANTTVSSSTLSTTDTTMLITNASLTTMSTVTNDSFVTSNVNQSMTTIPNITSSVTTPDTTMSVTNISLATLSTTDGNQTTISNVTSMVTESTTTLNGTSSPATAESNSTTSMITAETKLTTGTIENVTSLLNMTSTSEPINMTTIVMENVTTSGIFTTTTVFSTEPARVKTAGTTLETTSGTTSTITQQTTFGTTTTSRSTPVATTSVTTSAEQSTVKSTEQLTTQYSATTNGQSTVETIEPITESVSTSSATTPTVPLTSSGSTTGSQTSATPAVPSESTVQAPIMESNDEVFLRFRITGMDFTEALTQPTSPQYMSLVAEVISLMQQVYSSDSNLRSIGVTRFLEGSVIPEVRLEFVSALDENSKRDVVGVLYDTVDESGGQLGNFTVDSVKSLDDSGSFQSVDACFILPCPSGAYCYVDPNDNQCWLTCDRNLGYCFNGGTCVAPSVGETIATCSCSSDYEGRRCDVEKTTVAPTDNLQSRLITILASICAVMAVLFFILAIVLICWCRRLRYTKRVIEEDAAQVAKWQDRARRSRARRDAESSGDETADGQSVVAGTSYIRTEPDAKLPRNLVAIPDDIDTSSGSNFYFTDSDSDSDIRPKIIEGGVSFPFFGGSGSIPDLLASAADYEMDVMQKGNRPLSNSMRGRSVSFSDITQVISDDDRIGWENFTFGSEAVNPATNKNFQMRWDFQVGGNRSGDNADDADGKGNDGRNKGGGGLSGETNA